MRSKKIWFIIIPVVLVALIAACFFLYKPLYYRVYLGDRIKGEVQMDIDGQRALFDEARTQKHWNIEGSFSVEDHTAKITLKAGDYGMYDFDIYVVGLDEPIQISVMQYNWWNVHTFFLDISVDTDTNTVFFQCDSTDLDEGGEPFAEERAGEVDLTKEKLSIYA